MRVKLNQPVDSKFYGIITCAELLDSGEAWVECVPNFGRNRVTKYFVTLVNPKDYNDESYCFEIGQKAYESRAAKGQNVKPEQRNRFIESPDLEAEIKKDSVWQNDIDCYELCVGRWEDHILTYMVKSGKYELYYYDRSGDHLIIDYIEMDDPRRIE